MKKDFYEIFVKTIDKLLPLLLLCTVGMVFLDLLTEEKITNISSLHWVAFIATFAYIIILWLMRTYFARKRTDVYKLDKWIQYDKQRIEIEEQMDALSMQLMNSDITKYIDINRLIFSGQSQLGGKGLINYNTFLQQFGLEKGTIKLKENSGAFLTPFNKKGDQLYKTCREILSDTGIFLQRSDNYVDKDDILMNIVSLIVQSEIIIVNIDGRNPNVYYELGIAHALGKPTILLSEIENGLIDKEFDIKQKYIIFYRNYSDLKDQLLVKITQIRKSRNT